MGYPLEWISDGRAAVVVLVDQVDLTTSERSLSVDVRTEAAQTVDEMEALGAAGAAILSPERIALNPDCGFAPDAGEPPSIDEAYEKLSRLTQAAKRLRNRFAS